MLIKLYLTNYFDTGGSRNILPVAVCRFLSILFNESHGHKSSNSFTSPLLMKLFGLSLSSTSLYE